MKKFIKIGPHFVPYPLVSGVTLTSNLLEENEGAPFSLPSFLLGVEVGLNVIPCPPVVMGMGKEEDGRWWWWGAAEMRRGSSSLSVRRWFNYLGDGRSCCWRAAGVVVWRKDLDWDSVQKNVGGGGGVSRRGGAQLTSH